jgi:hypothetical protein
VVIVRKISDSLTLSVQVRRSMVDLANELLTERASSFLVKGVNGDLTPARATPLASPGARS